MFHLFGGAIDHLLHAYGYWAVFGLVLLETTGIPAPGETMLIAAAAYAGATHQLSIAWVIGAAVAAAILGDNAGFWIGREGGWRLLCRYGSALHIDAPTIKVGMYVFRRHGGKLVFFGRFIPIFRTWGAILAGVSRFPWLRFLPANALGGASWALLWGLLAFGFGKALEHMETWASVTAIAVAVLISAIAALAAKRRASDLRGKAERAFPGDLSHVA